MRVLIADDEAPARERLRQLLTGHPEFDVIAEAETGPQTLELVASLKPGLLLLDIQMPGASGLEVAACLPSPRPAIIFCTAFDQHAVDAFELNAVDYLLKPVSRARLAQSLARLPAGSAEPGLDRLIKNGHGYLSRLLVRSGGHYLVVPTAKAAWFESQDGSTQLTTSDGQVYWIDPPLQELESRIDPGRFFRVSRAAIVNLSEVVQLHPMPGGSAEIVLKRGARLEVSRRRVRPLIGMLEKS